VPEAPVIATVNSIFDKLILAVAAKIQKPDGIQSFERTKKSE
jgi:hypothetical protein